MPYTEEQLDKMFDQLPEDVKEAMTSVSTTNVLTEIQKKYNLHIDQIGQLSAEMAMVMLGAVPPQRFIPNIQRLMNIPPDTAKKITEEVNQRIFKTVRESLMNLHKLDEEEKEMIEKQKEAEIKNKQESNPTAGGPKPAADKYREQV